MCEIQTFWKVEPLFFQKSVHLLLWARKFLSNFVFIAWLLLLNHWDCIKWLSSYQFTWLFRYRTNASRPLLAAPVTLWSLPYGLSWATWKELFWCSDGIQALNIIQLQVIETETFFNMKKIELIRKNKNKNPCSYRKIDPFLWRLYQTVIGCCNFICCKYSFSTYNSPCHPSRDINSRAYCLIMLSNFSS